MYIYIATAINICNNRRKNGKKISRLEIQM